MYGKVKTTLEGKRDKLDKVAKKALLEKEVIEGGESGKVVAYNIHIYPTQLGSLELISYP